MSNLKPPHSEQIKWVLSTLGCPELDLGGAAELASRYGVGALELRALEGRIDLPDYLAEAFGQPEALAREAEALGIEVLILDSSFRVLEHGTKERDDLLRLLPWAEALGCRYVRVFDGGTSDPSLSREHLDSFRRTFEWWDSERGRLGSSCDWAVETHWGLSHPLAIEALQPSLHRPTPILWDSHHTWHGSGWGMAETWSSLRSQVVHVHIKDSLLRPGESPPYQLVLPGEGNFPLRELLEVLAQEPNPPPVSLEWERFWNPTLPPVEQALARLCALETSG